MDMKKLLESIAKFAGEPDQKPGDQVRGTEKAKNSGKEHPFKGRLVGDSVEPQANMLEELSQEAQDKSIEWKLSEAWAEFKEEAFKDTNDKRAARKGSRPSRGHNPIPRYKQLSEATKDELWQGWTIRYEWGNKKGQPVRWMAFHSKRGPQDAHKGQSNSVETALADAKAWIQSGGNAKEITTSTVTIDFNVKFASDIVNGNEFFAKIVAGPTLIISMDSKPGFKRSHIRTQKSKATQETTLLPMISLTNAEATAAGLKAHGRYLLGDTGQDSEGNTTFPLIYQSTVQAKGDVMRLGKPGLTVAMNREVSGLEEGWNTGSDRVHLPDEPSTYWSNTGALQKEYEALYDKLVPAQGAADTIEGEVLRAASKIVYRHYNDGDEFNQASFGQLEQYIGKVTSYDDLAHKATEFALKANGNYHPNAGWDSLDVMEYGPEDYSDDYDEDDSWDDEEDTSWDQDDDEVDESASLSHTIEAHGIKGMKRTPWHKSFKNADALHAWAEKNDAEIYATRELEHAKQGVDEVATYRVTDAPVDKEYVYTVMKTKNDVRDFKNMDKWVSLGTHHSLEDAKRVLANNKRTDQLGSKFKIVRRARSRLAGPQGVLPESAADQVYTVDITRRDRTRSTSGTIPELLDYFGYTLEVGKSYERERGRYKINLTPKNIQSLVDNLNKAASNGAANGAASTYYSVGGEQPVSGVEPEETYGDGEPYFKEGIYDNDKTPATKVPPTSKHEAQFKEPYTGVKFREPTSFREGDTVFRVDQPDVPGEIIALYKGDPVVKVAYQPKGQAFYILPTHLSWLGKPAVEEGWESGPEERAPRERDPDAEYDARRQEKLDIEAEKEQAKRPQTKVYTLTGRGPNMEPNYKFPGEYDSQEAAIAARDKLMADPNTPNPRMIGISTHTKFLDEYRETPLRDKEDYNAKRKALQDLQSDPDTSKDSELSAEVVRRLAGLNQQAKNIGIDIDESRGHKIIARKLADIERSSDPIEVDDATRAEQAKADYKDYVAKAKKENPNFIPLFKIDEYGADATGSAVGNKAATTSPDDAKDIALASQSLKSATKSTASAPNIVKALDHASQGKQVGQQDMRNIEPLMKDMATVASTPKLAGQFKNLVQQIDKEQKLQAK